MMILQDNSLFIKKTGVQWLTRLVTDWMKLKFKRVTRLYTIFPNGNVYFNLQITVREACQGSMVQLSQFAISMICPGLFLYWLYLPCQQCYLVKWIFNFLFLHFCCSFLQVCGLLVDRTCLQIYFCILSPGK